MIHKLLPLFILIPCSSLLAAQEAEEKPLPEGVVARVGDQEITVEQYKDFLYQRLGKRPLNQLTDQVLVQQTAAEYGITFDPAAVEAAFEERMQQNLANRDLATFEAMLLETGQDLASFQHNLRSDLRHEQLLDGLVMATRVATDERIQAQFDAQYGQGGIRLRLRHVLVMPHFLRAERIRGGANAKDIDLAEMDAEAQALIERCSADFASGASFEDLVAQYSHDQVSLPRGGELTNYRPGLYGPSFTEAVMALQAGEVSGVVKSGAGYHLVQLVERTETRLEDVRAKLVQEVMEAEPSWQEREQLLASLRESAKIQLW